MAEPTYQHVPPGWVWSATDGWWAPAGMTPDGRKLAGFGRRVGGFFLDLAIWTIPTLVVFFAGFALLVASSPAEGEEAGAGFVVGLFGLMGAVFVLSLLPIVAEAELVHRRGATFGMRILGLRVIDAKTGGPISRGRAYGRTAFGRFLSAQVYIGYLWPLWDDRNRTLHDLVVGTVVIEEG